MRPRGECVRLKVTGKVKVKVMMAKEGKEKGLKVMLKVKVIMIKEGMYCNDRRRLMKTGRTNMMAEIVMMVMIRMMTMAIMKQEAKGRGAEERK